MRRALNENPLVQAAFIGVLALGVGFLLLTRMGGSAEPAPEASSADPAATASVADSSTGAAEASPAADAGFAPSGSDPAAEAPGAAPVPAPGGGAEFTAGPGLPEEVVRAYDDGDAVVLLIVRERGIDDRKVQAMVERLRSRPDTAVFVTRAAGIARYSRITNGVDVDRTPALVVVRPKRLNDGPIPAATVSYGFRGPTSVEQALEDALYEGRTNLPYYPE